MMNQDPIIREVRAIREELAAQHGYNVRALYEEAKRRERKSGRKIVRLKPQRIEQSPEQRGT